MFRMITFVVKEKINEPGKGRRWYMDDGKSFR